MCEDFELYSEIQLSQVDFLSDGMSDYEVLAVPIPRTIQVSGTVEALSVQSDKYLCLDSDNEQENSASMPIEHVI